MKNPDLNIRIGVLAALQTTLPGTTVRDMEFIDGDTMPGILLSSQTNAPDNTKSNFGTQSTLLIQIYSKQSLSVSRYEIDQIADTVLQTLIPQDSGNYVSVTGFQVLQVDLDSTDDDSIPESDGITAVKRLRLRFYLREIS